MLNSIFNTAERISVHTKHNSNHPILSTKINEAKKMERVSVTFEIISNQHSCTCVNEGKGRSGKCRGQKKNLQK